MSVSIFVGDVREQLRALPSNSIDCIVTSPPYWGLRCYGVPGQIGLEPTLGEHIATLVDVFREVRRTLKARGTLWLNYGDCYAAAPNGKSAAAYKAEGTDDRAFRDKPFSTVGPVAGRTYYGEQNGSRGVDRDFHDAMRAKAGPILEQAHSSGRGQRGDVFRTRSALPPSGRVVAGGYLKPKDLCMIANRLAIALQDDGWWVRSEIVWHKPNPMPELVYDRPTSAHEKVWLLTKGEDYFYNHEAIREPVTGGAHVRAVGPKSRVSVDRVRPPRKLAEPRSGTKNNSSMDVALVGPVSETRNARNVWTIAPRAFREAHFATFPPALAERCIRAGVPKTVCAACGSACACGGLCTLYGRKPGHVLDPFGGAGTVGLVAEQLGLDATLIELNPEYAAMAARRIGPAARIIGDPVGMEPMPAPLQAAE